MMQFPDIIPLWRFANLLTRYLGRRHLIHCSAILRWL